MKKLLVISLVFTLLFQSGKPLVIGSWYLINKTEITDKFCINKDNDSFNCAGKCHLNRILESDKSSDKNTPSNLPQEEETNFTVFNEIINKQLLFRKKTSKKIQFVFEFNYFLEPVFFVFHPPRIKVNILNC